MAATWGQMAQGPGSVVCPVGVPCPTPSMSQPFLEGF